MPFTPAKPPFLTINACKLLTAHSLPQSLSLAESVITFVLLRSKERTVALKFPFSVATFIVESPLPGGPLTGESVGLGVTTGFMVGIGVGARVGNGLGDGERVGTAVGSGVFVAVVITFFIEDKFIKLFLTAKYKPTKITARISRIGIITNPFVFINYDNTQ